ncbi:DUF6894 family protein [Shinella sp. G-2]|uniref:DUF6894 family protein n=1 Tax=Shinella sp. G-2 TaxID=3133141 RepID=UPI003D058091
MPRYFFHIRDKDNLEIDPEGLEFPDLESAVIDARMAAKEMLAERLMAGEQLDGQRLEITDERGATLETITFRSVLNFH